MADFEMIEMSRALRNSRGKKYPRLILRGMVDTDEIANMVAERTGSSRSDVIGVLDAVSHVMSRQMALGYSVRLRGIGRFAPKVGLKANVQDEYADSGTRRNAQSVEVTDINYRADRDLVTRTDADSDLHRINLAKSAPVTTTPEQRLALVLQYLDEHSMMRVGEYAVLTGLERVRAGKELRHFAEQGHLEVQGRAPHIYYAKP